MSELRAPCLRCGQRDPSRRRRGLCHPCVRDGHLADYPVLHRRTADVAEDYRVIVLRDPHAHNADIAAHLGMKPGTLIKTLAHARATGLLDIRRVAVGRRPEIARYGETNGVCAR